MRLGLVVKVPVRVEDVLAQVAVTLGQIPQAGGLVRLGTGDLFSESECLREKLSGLSGLDLGVEGTDVLAAHGPFLLMGQGAGFFCRQGRVDSQGLLIGAFRQFIASEGPMNVAELSVRAGRPKPDPRVVALPL